MIPKTPPVTIAVVGLCIVVYLIMWVFGEQAVVEPLLISEYIRPTLPEIRNGEIWRLVTPAFIHFGLFHIVFNMLWTWELGRLIEWRQGGVLLIALLLITAAVSNLAQYVVSGPLFGGMSGVVYGLFGYIWLQGITNPKFAVKMNPAVVKLLLVWFVICWTGILEMVFGIAIANTAHTAGLLSGVTLSLLVSGAYRLLKPRS